MTQSGNQETSQETGFLTATGPATAPTEGGTMSDVEAAMIGQHKGHCCLAHGCKYGDDDCPVKCGKAVQTGPCEQCHDGASGKFAEVAICRTKSNMRGDFITIRIGSYRDNIIEVELSLEDFALAITGRGGILGAVRERKRAKKGANRG